MIKHFFVFILITAAIISCKDSAKEAETKTLQEQENFIQLTSFLHGQLIDIERDHLNPIVYITENNKTDSTWVSNEKIVAVVAPFLNPVIDSTNLKTYFKLNSFYDSTMKRFIFAHEPTSNLPDDFPLLKWDVFVDPEAEKIEKLYIEKQVGDLRQILTWNTDRSCKIVDIKNDKVVKTTEMIWEFTTK